MHEAMGQHNRSRGVLPPPALLTGVAFCVAAVLTWAQEKPADPSTEANAAIQAEARQTYESVCAACHGLDARGSERGPDIASRPEVVRKTDPDLAQILANGKPAGGMPSFSSFGVAKISAMVAYLRTLQGRGKVLALPGDPERGRALFFGKAKCSDCHSLAGQGGFFAADLASYSGNLDANELRTMILSPDRELDPRRGLAQVVLSDGSELAGAVRNEDNFSIQLQTADGTFHLLSKSEVRSQTYVGASGMPRDYGSTLRAAELNDVISFLLRSASEHAPQPSSRQIGVGDN
jgi:putative heme-binding domain-containing protein